MPMIYFLTSLYLLLLFFLADIIMKLRTNITCWVDFGPRLLHNPSQLVVGLTLDIGNGFQLAGVAGDVIDLSKYWLVTFHLHFILDNLKYNLHSNDR